MCTWKYVEFFVLKYLPQFESALMIDSHSEVVLLEYAKNILKEGEMPNINITITEEVPPELIAKMKTMGLDIEKVKVKKDTKDAQLKA